MLNQIEKSDIRRHLGFPALAVNRWAAGSPQELRSYYINAILEQLENRLNEIDVVSESRLTGKCLGLVSMTGRDPAPGDTVTVTFFSDAISGGSESVSITALDGEHKFELCSRLGGLCSQNSDLAAARFTFSGPFFGIAVQAANILPQLQVKAPAAFTMTVSFTGLVSATIDAQGDPLEPKATVGQYLGEDIVKYGYLPILNHLEGAIAGVTQNADVARAGEYVRGFELQERQKLYSIWQHKLSTFLGFNQGGGRGGFIV